MSANPKFCVLISGGGIAGLTLANSLERANIDWLLFESRNEIAPQVGASIGIFPHGGRILDQLGAYSEILSHVEPGKHLTCWYDGKLVKHDDSPQLALRRSGYPMAFLDRQLVLQSLYRTLPNKSKVLLNKRVTRVDHSKDGIVVQCRDGTSYAGDIIVGADGVHSLIRHEMWRQANLAHPGSFGEQEQNLIRSEYSCIYGISNPVDGFEAGEVYKIHGKDISYLVICGINDRVFWFVFSKMDKVYQVPNIPRFTTKDAEALIEKNISTPLTDRVSLRDVWARRLSITMVPLEEAFHPHWTWGRFAAIGDSVHKMTPNIGQGGNAAIESAAALANALHQLVQHTAGPKPSSEEIEKSLKSFQEHREVRAKAILTLANKVTRIDALKGPIEQFIGLHVLPHTGDFLQNRASYAMVGAEKLEFLPDTERSLTATMPYNPNFAAGLEESLVRRALKALPLLLIGFYAYTAIPSTITGPEALSTITAALTISKMDFGTGTTFDLAPTYYGGFSWMDTLWRPYMVFFAPAILDVDSTQRLQTFSFLVEIAPLLLIWLLERYRRANVLVLATQPVLLWSLAAQVYGIGAVVPLYFFLHYIQSPISTYAAADLRMTNVAAARMALPTVVLTYLLPLFAMFFAPSSALRLQVNALWQIFPIISAVTFKILSTYTVSDTTMHDRIHNPTADLPYVRKSVMVLVAISAVVFNWVRFSSPQSLVTIFLTQAPIHDFVSGTAQLFKIDHLSCFAACFIWLGLLFKDLKDFEMIKESWARLVIYAMVVTFIAGPGAVLGAAWLWREEILASKPAKGAVVRRE